MSVTFSTELANYAVTLKNFIKSVEGDCPDPYIDSVGVPTIGWGFAINTANGLRGNNSLGKSVSMDYWIQTIYGIDQSRLTNSRDIANEQAFIISIKAVLNDKFWTGNPSFPSVEWGGTPELDRQLAIVFKARANAVKNYSPDNQSIW